MLMRVKYINIKTGRSMANCGGGIYSNYKFLKRFNLSDRIVI